jgi:hypothetical protein
MMGSNSEVEQDKRERGRREEKSREEKEGGREGDKVGM